MKRRYSTSEAVLSFLMAIAAVAIFAASQIVMTTAATVCIMIIGIVREISDSASSTIISASTLVADIIAVAVFSLILKIRKKRIKEEFGLIPPSSLSVVTLIILALGAGFAVSLLLAYIPFTDDMMSSYSESYDYLMDGNRALNFILTVIIAPVAEEITFRATAYKVMSDKMPKYLAMATSAAMFGILHGTFVWFIYTFLLGFLLAWIYDRFGSVVPGIIFHMAFNLFGSVPEVFSWMPDILFNVIFCIALVMIPPCIVTLYMMTQYNRSNAKTDGGTGTDDTSLLDMF